MGSYKVEIPADASVEDRIRLARLNNEFTKEYRWQMFDGTLLALAIGLIVSSVIILARAKESDPKLIEWVEKYFYPMITLIIGYITGKAVKGSSSKSA